MNEELSTGMLEDITTEYPRVFNFTVLLFSDILFKPVWVALQTACCPPTFAGG